MSKKETYLFMCKGALSCHKIDKNVDETKLKDSIIFGWSVSVICFSGIDVSFVVPKQLQNMYAYKYSMFNDS